MLLGLSEASVEFVVIGGVAAVSHGSTYQTNDLDICYRESIANVDRLVTLLAAWNAYPRGWEPGLPFVLDARTFKTTPILTLRCSEGDLDLLDFVRGVGSYEECHRRSQLFDAFGITFRALDLPALISAKRASDRPRDREHLIALEALLRLTEE